MIRVSDSELYPVAAYLQVAVLAVYTAVLQELLANADLHGAHVHLMDWPVVYDRAYQRTVHANEP